MKFSKVKKSLTLIALVASVSIGAQKESKKFTEKFDVNKDVKIEIDASNAEIDVTTWNKNQVLVEAIIEVEGLSKKEADKYLKNYKFEALGNRSKVKIVSKGKSSFGFPHDDFVMFNKDFKMPEIVIPDIEIPEMDFDFDFENIVIPEIDMDKIFLELDDIEFDFDKYNKDGKSYFFHWKDGVHDIKIKSKKDWEKFKKTKEYKEWKAEMKKNGEKMRKELAKMKKEMHIDNEKMRKELVKMKKELREIDRTKIQEAHKKAMEAMKKIDMSKIRKELAKVNKEMKNIKFDYNFNTDSNEVIINDKKVKITKKIKVKVPKGATFDLNTRHCKVKLPKTKASGKVSYGTFDATGLNGGNLKIYSSPTTIDALNTSTLFLNNTTDAKIASVVNSNITASSGNLIIDKVLSDVDLNVSFGDVEISAFDTAVKNFIMDLKHSKAIINIGALRHKIKDSYLKKNSFRLNENFGFKTKDNSVKVGGKYSNLILRKG